MCKVQCNTCGSEEYETRRTDYLYRHNGQYLLVPNTPVEICLSCGAVYYEASVLKEIERRFFAIHSHAEEPDHYLQVPAKAYS